MNISTCKSCGALILCAKTASGKSMPLDAEPRADGNVWIDGAKAMVGTPPDDRPRYVSQKVRMP